MEKIKLPPQAKEIEQAIIGAILIDSNCFPIVIDKIFEDIFYDDSNRIIFKTCVQLFDKSMAIDIMTVAEQLRKNNQIETVGGLQYLMQITNAVVSSAHIDTHIGILLEKYIKRSVINISGNLYNEAYQDNTDAFDLLNKADKEIINTENKVLGNQLKDISFFTKEVHQQYYEVKQTGVLGISTGLIQFDKMFSGIVAPDLMIIAARPGAGKTALALSITKNITIDKGIAGAWFSLEMDGVQLVRRLASMEANLPHDLIRKGEINANDNYLFLDALDIISKAPLYIEDNPSVNIRSIRTRANVLKRKYGIKYIIVDYLQLMSSTSNKSNRENEISEISRGLKVLAKELGIPVIALSQLSREVEKRNDKMPQLSDLRESGAIEQDADEVLFLMRPEYYNFQNDVQIGDKSYNFKNLCICKPAKNRHGDCLTFALWFDGPTMKFNNHPNDLENNLISIDNQYIF